MARRNGFSLTEMMIVIVMFGILVGIGFPKLNAALVRSNVRSARTTVANLFAQARVASVQGNRSAWLKVDGNQVLVVAKPRFKPGAGTIDTVGTVQDLFTQYGVTLTLTRSGAAVTPDSIEFSSRGTLAGVGLGNSGAVIKLSKSSKTDSLKIDYLGRVTK